jgi:hypothetical protein
MERWRRHYEYAVRPHTTTIGVVRRLSVRRYSGADGISWDTLQRIKCDVLGEDATAVEVYPAAIDTVNNTNTRHLWAWPQHAFEVTPEAGCPFDLSRTPARLRAWINAATTEYQRAHGRFPRVHFDGRVLSSAADFAAFCETATHHKLVGLYVLLVGRMGCGLGRSFSELKNLPASGLALLGL